jgi:hypothetical protein
VKNFQDPDLGAKREKKRRKRKKREGRWPRSGQPRLVGGSPRPNLKAKLDLADRKLQKALKTGPNCVRTLALIKVKSQN